MKLLLASWILFSGSLAAQDGLSTQSIKNFHTNQTLLPACIEDELHRINAITRTIAKSRNPTEAWVVAEAMLCGKAPRGNMPSLVAQEQFGINTEPGPSFALVSREKIEPLKGEAYGVNVSESRSDIMFNYSTAGVCVGGFTLRYIASDWLLVANSVACD